MRSGNHQSKVATQTINTTCAFARRLCDIQIESFDKKNAENNGGDEQYNKEDIQYHGYDELGSLPLAGY